MVKDLSKLAKEIIKNNQYMTIGSLDKDGLTWVAPVVYTFDKDYNFYFVTIPSSRHGVNIEKSNKISVAIFDSQQSLGEGVGVQAEAIVKKLPITETPKAALLYFSRKYPFGKMSETFEAGLKKLLQGKFYRLYKATLTNTWLNNPNSDIDERVEIRLK